MGIESIEVSKLTGKLQQLAQVADDGNGKLEGKEIEIFQSTVEAANLEGTNEYKAIFGSEIKTATNPQANKYSEKTIERMERYVLTILKEEASASPEKLTAKLTERLGASANDPKYLEMQADVTNILNAINTIGYNSKDDVKKLEDKVKEQLKIDKKDNFKKDVLKALVKNAEQTQAKKEYEEVKVKYDELVNKGTLEEEAYKAVKKEFQPKGSYYKDLFKNGSFFYKAIHFRGKLGKFEKSHIMSQARTTAREAVYESDGTTKKEVKKDAETTLKENDDYNKYTKRALGGERSFADKINFRESDMGFTIKNHAAKNRVEDIKEEGLSEQEIHDAVDKKKTFLFFKQKTELFEALKSSGLIEYKGVDEKGEEIWDVSSLSEIIGLHVGSDYTLNKQSDDFKALAEKTKTTSALAAATLLQNLNEKEAEMLVKMCGYNVEGKNIGKAIVKATAGALVTGLVTAGSAAAAVATNKRPVLDTVINNHNYTEINIKCDTELIDDIKDQFSGAEGVTVNVISGGIQIIAEQNQIVPLFWKGSRHILNSALKAAIPGAVVGLIAGLKDDPEKPITSTQFECTTLEEYEKVLNSEVKQRAIDPKYKDALMLIAMTFAVKDKDGNITGWDCEGYKSFLNKAAGNGGVLNRAELMGALEGLKDVKKPEAAEETDETEEIQETQEEKEHTYATHNKAAVDAQYENIPVIDGSTTSWAKIAGQYDCLIQKYTLPGAIRIIKIAQAINNGDYSKENLEKLLKLSKKGHMNLQNVDGIDFKAYMSAINATYLPALKKDSNGNPVPGTGVKVPANLADCERDESKDLKAPKANGDGPVVKPSGNAADRKKVKDGEDAKFYARFDGGEAIEYTNMKDRDDAVDAFKKEYPNAKVEKWNKEEE